ncbi:MAG TPA: DAK2 domain-containing protein [Firmicutes bacterium]|nr:DAK2 domain-containing protein [Bacillota bacterium]
MLETLNSSQIIDLLGNVAANLQRRKEWLTQLDSVAGDGDLGVTMTIGFSAIVKEMENLSNETVGNLLFKAGIALNRAAPSTLGTLLATAFMRAGREVKTNPAVGLDELVSMAKAAMQGIMERGGAKPGDKTILDAFMPAVQAMEKAAGGGKDILVALEAALEAARDGMKATEAMRPAVGRASWIADRSLGNPDPGAGALVVILEGAVDYCRAISGEG